jgi:membrane protein involved in colicin uptake
MSQIMENYPLLPASHDEGELVAPPVVIAVPLSPKEAKKAEKEAEKAAEKAKKEAEKAAEKAKKEAEKAAEKAKKEAEKAAEKAKKEAEKEANKKPRGRPPKTANSPALSATAAPSHNQEDIAQIAHLKDDIAADENELASLRQQIASLQAENKRLNDLLTSVRSLVQSV